MLPISIGLVEQGHTSGSFTVRATGYSDAGCSAFSAEQSATLQFLADHTLELDLDLLTACEGRMCAPGTTCYDSGACRSDARASLPEYQPDQGFVTDAGMQPDLETANDLSSASDLAGDLAGPQPDLSMPSLCTSPNSPGQLCESFESGSINAGLWSTSLTNATDTVDTTRAYRGTHSLKVSTQAVAAATSVYGHIVDDNYLGTNNDVFVRAFYYIPSVAFSNTYVLSTVTSVTSNVDIDIGGKAAGNFHINTGGSSPQSPISVDLMPTDTWFCFEYEINQPAGTFTGWLNDGATPVLSQGSITMDALTGIGIGLSFYGPSVAEAAHDIWIDEIIVDGQRIGCAK
jgi:hypothetical protein